MSEDLEIKIRQFTFTQGGQIHKFLEGNENEINYSIRKYFSDVDFWSIGVLKVVLC